MGLFSTLKTERLIAEIKESGDPGSPRAQKAMQKLAGMGAAAVEPIVEALGQADKRETVAYVDALAAVIDNKTFPLLIKGMAQNNARAVAGIAWALSSSKNYSPGMLLEALTNPDASKSALLEVIGAQRSRFSVRELLASQTQPWMTALDCADPSMRVDKRNESLSAPQALALLNNGFMVTQARYFAERLERERPNDLARQIERAFRLAFGRAPAAAERAKSIAFARAYGLPNLCRALLNLNEFTFAD